ncbi:MAG: DUF3794 domain-containing protein [Ruminococcus sp.]|nr:DUF3794 domain-containing protein [Ruminococcus sp.]
MDNNEIKVRNTAVCTEKTVLDTTCEQPVEKDIVLPDYYPDIFRVLRCCVTPSAEPHSVSGGKLSYDVDAKIRVWYLSEGSNRINCIEQDVGFLRSAELENDAQDVLVKIDAKCDYINCRASGSRRLDIRGALSIRIKAVGAVTTEIISDAEGAGIETKKEPVTYPAKRLAATKRITLIEELELSKNKPPIGTVLDSSCRVIPKEHKMIAGKLITKGDCELKVMYTAGGEDEDAGVQTMSYTLAFSQIIDIDGIDDDFEADVDISCTECEISPKQGDGSLAECEIVLRVMCRAVKYEQEQMVTDAFSTMFDTTLTRAEGCTKAEDRMISESCEISCTVTKGEEGLGAVCGCSARCSAVSSRYDEESGRLTVYGNVCFEMLGRNSDGVPVFIEKDEAFEKELAVDGSISDRDIEVCAETESSSYRLTGESSADLSAVVSIKAKIRGLDETKLISGIEIDSESEEIKTEGFCVRLCRCEQGEELWDVAKRYRASVEAIRAGNDIDDEQTLSGVLLIPSGGTKSAAI